MNQKIEGFFDVCRERQLSGAQGVLIPQANVKHLMLRADVVDAVKHGRFAVYAVENVDEALELLTGLPAGTRDAEGVFPEESVNGRIEMRLAVLADLRRRFSRSEEEEEAGGEGC